MGKRRNIGWLIAICGNTSQGLADAQHLVMGGPSYMYIP